jgi:hypothetical protein
MAFKDTIKDLADLLGPAGSIIKAISGVNFTKTPHLPWDKANEVAVSLKQPLADLFIDKYGSTKSAASKSAELLIKHLIPRWNAASWGIEAEPISNVVASEKATFEGSNFGGYSNVEFIRDVVMWRFAIYVALNYDSRRPQEFKDLLSQNAHQAFGFYVDTSGLGSGGATDGVSETLAGVGGFFEKIFGGIGSIFGGSSSPGSGGATGNTMQIVLAFILLGAVIWFVTKKLK